MGWINFTYKCGHDGRRQFIGPVKDRQRRADWFGERNLCDACLAEQRAAESAAAASASAAAGLPTLVGTPKQVAWAETLRAAAIPLIDRFPRAIDETLDHSPDISVASATRLRDAAAAAMVEAKLETEAKEWIDSRATRDLIGSLVHKMAPALETELGIKAHSLQYVVDAVLLSYK